MVDAGKVNTAVKVVVLGKVAVSASKRFFTTVIMRYCDQPASRVGIRLVIHK